MNERGDTVGSLEALGHDAQVQETLRGWLRKAVLEMEMKPARAESDQGAR